MSSARGQHADESRCAFGILQIHLLALSRALRRARIVRFDQGSLEMRRHGQRLSRLAKSRASAMRTPPLDLGLACTRCFSVCPPCRSSKSDRGVARGCPCGRIICRCVGWLDGGSRGVGSNRPPESGGFGMSAFQCNVSGLSCESVRIKFAYPSDRRKTTHRIHRVSTSARKSGIEAGYKARLHSVMRGTNSLSIGAK
jgi:hypothetical protein